MCIQLENSAIYFIFLGLITLQIFEGLVKTFSLLKRTLRVSNPKVWKMLYILTLSPVKWYHQCLGKLTQRRFVPEGSVYLCILIYNCDVFVMYLFIIIKCSFINKLKLGFVNVFIAEIRFIWFVTLNVMYFLRSLRDVVEQKCCSKWAEDESDFVRFWEDIGDRKNDCPLFYFISD